MVLQSVNTKKCTLTSRSECTKSNETLKETFRLQSYKTFHNDPYSIAKYRSDKKLSPAFYPINPSASPFPSSPEPK